MSIDLKALLSAPNPDQTPFLGVVTAGDPEAAVVAACAGVDAWGQRRTSGTWLTYLKVLAQMVIEEGFKAWRFGPGFEQRFIVYGLCTNTIQIDNPWDSTSGPENCQHKTLVSYLEYENELLNRGGTPSGTGA